MKSVDPGAIPTLIVDAVHDLSMSNAFTSHDPGPRRHGQQRVVLASPFEPVADRTRVHGVTGSCARYMCLRQRLPRRRHRLQYRLRQRIPPLHYAAIAANPRRLPLHQQLQALIQNTRPPFPAKSCTQSANSPSPQALLQSLELEPATSPSRVRYSVPKCPACSRT
ncbi:hypothetical protein BC828DRAFT_182437 [Blastocladiella britannica]|nr:hypothetical protein BC828DRAFT_182437 [Blastocladiella britannica]